MDNHDYGPIVSIHNIEVFEKYLIKIGNAPLNPAWVLWMLNIIKESDIKGAKLNPDYLTARYKLPNDPEPSMFLSIC